MEKKLYIFHMECGYAGSITVVAHDEKEARELMSGAYNYSDADEIERFEIEAGLVLANYGDL